MKHPFRIRPLLWTLTVLVGIGAWSTPLLAQDGTLEIHQACVATGCFPGDTPGWPVLITESGSYRLTSNLSVPDANTTAIQSTAEMIWLDLGGFVISGVTQCSGNPITCAPLGSGHGIEADLNNGGSVRNGTVHAMGGNGIEVGRGIVENVTVYGNGFTGILNSSGTTRNCRVYNNGATGISSGGGLVLDNDVSGNARTGISGTVGPTIRGNRIRGNGGLDDSPGIFTTNGFVIDNKIEANRGPGLESLSGTAYGNNMFGSNNLAMGPSPSNQVMGGVIQLGPNICQNTACP